MTAKAVQFVVAFSKPMVFAAMQLRHGAQGYATSLQGGRYIAPACRAVHAQTSTKTIGQGAQWHVTAQIVTLHLRSIHMCRSFQ